LTLIWTTDLSVDLKDYQHNLPHIIKRKKPARSLRAGFLLITTGVMNQDLSSYSEKSYFAESSEL